MKYEQSLARPVLLCLLLVALSACTLPRPPVPLTPRPTAMPILEVTPAQTRDIDATVTMYAGELLPTATPVGRYVVQPGDTFESLAVEFNTTGQQIAIANGVPVSSTLVVGQVITIPTPTQGEGSAPSPTPEP